MRKMTIADAIQVLHLPKDYNEAELKMSFLKKRSQHHPDKGGDSREFIKVQAAYDTLANFATGQIIHITLHDLKNGCTEIVNGTPVLIPPECPYRAIINGVEVRLRLPPTISIDKKGNLTETIKVSPFKIMRGGHFEHEIFDGEKCVVYLPPCADSSPLIKIANRGVWLNGGRRDYFLRLVPEFKPLLDYPEEEIQWLRNLLNTTPTN